MAATPTLVPDPTVIAVQAALFLVAVTAVKKLMVEPYERLRLKRESQTTGSTDAAKGLVERNLKITTELQTATNAALDRAKEASEDLRKKFSQQRDHIIAEAESKASALVEQASKAMSVSLKEQESKLASECERLTKDVFQQLIKV